MTSLTLDELQDLKFCVSDHKGYEGDSIHENLLNKINTMIEEYCEHTPSDRFYEQFMWQLCSKCGTEYK